MPTYSFDGFVPVVKPTSFIHPLASVIGNVIVGDHVYIGPSAVIRGDWGGVLIEDGCNVQENCTIHMFPGTSVVLQKGAHIGHGAVIHGAKIGENCLIGMNAVVMDDVELGKECIVGALSFVQANAKFENRSMIVGNPAKTIKTVSDEMIAWKSQGTKLYQELPNACHETLKECTPLSEIEKNRPMQPTTYMKWGKK